MGAINAKGTINANKSGMVRMSVKGVNTANKTIKITAKMNKKAAGDPHQKQSFNITEQQRFYIAEYNPVQAFFPFIIQSYHRINQGSHQQSSQT